MTNQNFLPYVQKPGRYLGNEYNAKTQNWDDPQIRFALVFPDLYEIGMSHLGLQILYHILNQQKNVLAERCFCPDLDAEKIIRDKKLELQSLETAHPLKEFDCIGITLPYELCYTNILTILDLAAIPFLSSDRDDSFPLIIGGGSCSLNPEPVADFFDAILLGDGEEAIVEISELLFRAKNERIDKHNVLQEMAKIKGVYIPSNYTPLYSQDNAIERIERDNDAPPLIQRRIVSDLASTSHLLQPLVPNAKIVHDRLGIEIARGCTRGCRFCQAGIIYRPVRERSIEQILDIARQGIENSGFEELALLSLSTGDYSCIDHLLPQLMDEFEESFVSVSMPSMRVGTLSQPVMDQIKRVRKTGFTIAPEAGSERLRQAINKGITEDDFLTTCRDAFSLGWNTIKLYFMIGLPTETKADVEEIAALAMKARKIADSVGKKRSQITVSVGTFVPKPHTPFQWQEQISLEESRERISFLKRSMPRKGCKLKWHDPEMSFLEGVFSRGDRRLTQLICAAWKKGARLDGWSDHFNLALWQEAAEQCSIDIGSYLRARDMNEILPWHHLSSGVDQSFLIEEKEKTSSGEYTPDCRYHGCQKCGLCDFETLQPIVHNKKKQSETSGEHPPPQSSKKLHALPEDIHFKYMVTYSRTGNACYLGHLEILQIIFRSLRRAGIKTNFSKGYNPSPKVSFGAALPVGVESHAEFFIMDLPGKIADTHSALESLNTSLPQGLSVINIALHSGRIAQSVVNSYEVNLPQELCQSEKDLLSDFLRQDAFSITRYRKGKAKEMDIRPLFKSINCLDDHTLAIELISTAGTPGIKVQEALQQILGLDENLVADCTIVKTGWQEHENE